MEGTCGQNKLYTLLMYLVMKQHGIRWLLAPVTHKCRILGALCNSYVMKEHVLPCYVRVQACFDYT